MVLKANSCNSHCFSLMIGTLPKDNRMSKITFPPSGAKPKEDGGGDVNTSSAKAVLT